MDLLTDGGVVSPLGPGQMRMDRAKSSDSESLNSLQKNLLPDYEVKSPVGAVKKSRSRRRKTLHRKRRREAVAEAQLAAVQSVEEQAENPGQNAPDPPAEVQQAAPAIESDAEQEVPDDLSEVEVLRMRSDVQQGQLEAKDSRIAALEKQVASLQSAAKAPARQVPASAHVPTSAHKRPTFRDALCTSAGPSAQPATSQDLSTLVNQLQDVESGFSGSGRARPTAEGLCLAAGQEEGFQKVALEAEGQKIKQAAP